MDNQREVNIVREYPPDKKSNKKYLIVIPILLLIAVALIYANNYYTLQLPMNEVLERDQRNIGINVDVQYKNFIQFNTIVYDLTEFTNKAPIDIFRVLLQFAQQMKEHDFDYVILGSKGIEKFMLKGSYFKKLGQEYDSQNPVYTTRTFTENLYNLDGSAAYGKWSGGILGVLTKQMEDFNDFIQKWVGIN